MKNILRIKNLFLIMLAAATFTGCVRKDDFYKKNTDETSRKEVVQISGVEDAVLFARDATPPLDTFVMIDLRRYPNKESDLNQSLTVKLVLKSSLIDDYNTANGTALVAVPFAAFSLSDDISSITFQPGEAIKTVKIRLDKGQLDLSQQYALGFSLVEAGANATINPSLKDALYIIAIKNQYDGRYRLDGAFYHPSQSPGYDAFTVDVEMHTTGVNKVKLFVPEFGGYYSPGLFGGSLNAFGAQEPEFTINQTTNAVTVQNAYAGAVTFYTMAVGYNSHYDPATKTIYAKWGYSYATPGVWDAGCREWQDVFTYLGPR